MATESEPWKQVRVSIGIAVYDPFADASVTETVRRADRHMYANKAKRKATPDNG